MCKLKIWYDIFYLSIRIKATFWNLQVLVLNEDKSLPFEAMKTGSNV